MRADLFDAAFKIGFLTGAVNDRRIVLVDDDPFGATQILQRDIVKLDAQLLGDELAAGENRNVFQHRLAPIAEAGRFDRHATQCAAELVNYEGGEGFAFEVFGDDDEGLAGLGDLFEDRQDLFHVADFFLVDQ